MKAGSQAQPSCKLASITSADAGQTDLCGRQQDQQQSQLKQVTCSASRGSSHGGSCTMSAQEEYEPYQQAGLDRAEAVCVINQCKDGDVGVGISHPVAAAADAATAAQPEAAPAQIEMVCCSNNSMAGQHQLSQELLLLMNHATQALDVTANQQHLLPWRQQLVQPCSPPSVSCCTTPSSLPNEQHLSPISNGAHSIAGSLHNADAAASPQQQLQQDIHYQASSLPGTQLGFEELCQMQQQQQSPLQRYQEVPMAVHLQYWPLTAMAIHTAGARSSAAQPQLPVGTIEWECGSELAAAAAGGAAQLIAAAEAQAPADSVAAAQAAVVASWGAYTTPGCEFAGWLPELPESGQELTADGVGAGNYHEH